MICGGGFEIGILFSGVAKENTAPLGASPDGRSELLAVLATGFPASGLSLGFISSGGGAFLDFPLGCSVSVGGVVGAAALCTTSNAFGFGFEKALREEPIWY